jgi:hypothetical protein
MPLVIQGRMQQLQQEDNDWSDVAMTVVVAENGLLHITLTKLELPNLRHSKWHGDDIIQIEFDAQAGNELRGSLLWERSATEKSSIRA